MFDMEDVLQNKLAWWIWSGVYYTVYVCHKMTIVDYVDIKHHMYSSSRR